MAASTGPAPTRYNTELRLAALILGGISLLIAFYPAYREVAGIIRLSFMPGALAFLILAGYPRPAARPRALGLLLALPLLVTLLSLADVTIGSAGAGALQYWYGYPYYWLHNVTAGSGEPRWSLFWPGLLIDYLMWLNLAAVALLIVWAVRRIISRVSPAE